jgi:hypothetical protein
MKRYTVLMLVVVVALIFAGVNVFALGSGPIGPGAGGGALASNHSSFLNVTETITPMGDGSYKYAYDFVNNDSFGVWFFGVYTKEPTTMLDPVNNLEAVWNVDHADLTQVAACYDARNIDPTLTGVVYSWSPGPYGGGLYPVLPGGSGTGFYFKTDVYDPSSKLYFYESIGNFAQENGGKVAGFGFTPGINPVVPEWPSALLAMPSLLGMALLKLRCRG